MWTLILSLALQLSGCVWSLILLRRHRDWRLVIVPLVILVMSVEPLGVLLGAAERQGGFAAGHTLVESLLVLLVPLLLDRYFRSQTRVLDSTRRNEELFRALATDSLGLICQHDLEGRLLFINPAAAGALGYPAERLIGRSVRDALAPPVREEFDSYLERIRSNKSDSGMMRVVTRQGSERIWLYRNVLFEGLGASPCVLGHALDVTELKAAEKELRKARQELESRVQERTAELARFRSAMDQAEMAILMSDQNRRFIDVNETACRKTGYRRDELLQLGPADLAVGHTPPEGEKWRQDALEMTKAGRAVVLPDHRIRRKDGSTFPVHVSITAQIFEGDIAVLAVVQDITEQEEAQNALRQAEEELRQLFSSVSDYLWSADVMPGGKVVYRYYSPVAEKITGRPPEFFMAGPERWLSTIHPEDRSRLESCVRRMLDEQLSQAEAEYRIVLPDGSLRWVRDSVTATGLESGVARLHGVVSDITDRKNAEQERLQLEAQLRQSQRLESLGVLAGGIAHDFNNILTSILGFGSLVDEDLPKGSPQKANLREVLRAGERAKQLVRQILTFSQRQEQERRPVDIAAAVGDALKLLRASLPYNVELRQRIRPDSGRVLTDFSCIQQVVLNLTTNACHALEPGGGVLEVTLEPLDLDDRLARELGALNPGPCTKLTVTDNGPGIDPTLRERIFDPFFTTKEVGKGTGLGLSMVHGIVSNFGGVVRLENPRRRGATFAVYLPQSSDAVESLQTGAGSASGA